VRAWCGGAIAKCGESERARLTRAHACGGASHAAPVGAAAAELPRSAPMRASLRQRPTQRKCRARVSIGAGAVEPAPWGASRARLAAARAPPAPAPPKKLAPAASLALPAAPPPPPPPPPPSPLPARRRQPSPSSPLRDLGVRHDLLCQLELHGREVHDRLADAVPLLLRHSRGVESVEGDDEVNDRRSLPSPPTLGGRPLSSRARRHGVRTQTLCNATSSPRRSRRVTAPSGP
jgi:hypothetical protein